MCRSVNWQAQTEADRGEPESDALMATDLPSCCRSQRSACRSGGIDPGQELDGRFLCLGIATCSTQVQCKAGKETFLPASSLEDALLSVAPLSPPCPFASVGQGLGDVIVDSPANLAAAPTRPGEAFRLHVGHLGEQVGRLGIAPGPVCVLALVPHLRDGPKVAADDVGLGQEFLGQGNYSCPCA
jgi:hypothetical protein